MRKQSLIGLSSVELYDSWRACYKSGRELHGRPSYEMASMAGRDFFLTQFVRSQGLLLDVAISYIFSSKKFLFAEHTFALNSF